MEKGEIKGYRVGTSGHWRVLSKDLAVFLKNNNIPFPKPEEIGIDLKCLAEPEGLPTCCWEFFQNKMTDHIRPNASCEDCLVYKVKSINCYALRKEVGQKAIYCGHSCEDCAYFPPPWSAYVRLLSVKNREVQRFYETEALRGGWSVKRRNILK